MMNGGPSAKPDSQRRLAGGGIVASAATPRSIAVFRALNLGDMLCSMPAFKALRAALPDTKIVLIGLASAAPLVERNRDCIDELLIFPGDPAFPEQTVQHDALPRFYRSVARRHFDLILQMHGSGTHSNRLVRAMRARQWAGFVPQASMAEPGRLMPWPDDLPEARRYLALLAWMGVEVPQAASPTLNLSSSDHAEATAVARERGLVPERCVLVHPGARLVSRRWPVERYAAVASALIQRGWQVAVTGSASEASLAAQLQRMTHGEAINLCGATSLGGLAALLDQTRLLICNDTGVSHVAASVGARSIVIASGSDVRRWAPENRKQHVVLHWPMPCRPCMRMECPYAHPCARAVTVEQVLLEADRALEESEYEWAGA